MTSRTRHGWTARASGNLPEGRGPALLAGISDCGPGGGASVWNEFLLATVFLTDQELFTVVTSYYNFTARFSRDWGLTSAAAMMMIAPILIIFLALQRRFIDGLTQGGLKA